MAEKLDYYDAWSKRIKQVSDAWKEFGLCFVENTQLVIEEIVRFTIQYRRESLAFRLGGSKLAWWIANNWPARWLPKLELPDEENPTD